MLSRQQQQLIEENLEVAEAAVRNLRRALYSFEDLLNRVDLQSAAYEGVCKAARTYDKEVSSNVRGYFYLAARNCALREVERELKHFDGRISFHEKVEFMIGTEQKSRALECLDSLEDAEKEWLEQWAVLGDKSGGSYAALHRQHGVGLKKVKSILNKMIDRFVEKYNDFCD